MLRSHVPRRLQDAEPVVSFYLPMLKEYISDDVLTSANEQELKRAVKKAGGMVNTGGLFLSTTSQATIVTSKVGVNRRSVMQVPRSKIPPEPLKLLDKCKCIRILILHAEFNSYDISVCNHNDPCTQVIDKDDGEDNTDSEAV